MVENYSWQVKSQPYDDNSKFYLALFLLHIHECFHQAIDNGAARAVREAGLPFNDTLFKTVYSLSLKMRVTKSNAVLGILCYFEINIS